MIILYVTRVDDDEPIAINVSNGLQNIRKHEYEGGMHTCIEIDNYPYFVKESVGDIVNELAKVGVRIAVPK